MPRRRNGSPVGQIEPVVGDRRIIPPIPAPLMPRVWADALRREARAETVPAAAAWRKRRRRMNHSQSASGYRFSAEQLSRPMTTIKRHPKAAVVRLRTRSGDVSRHVASFIRAVARLTRGIDSPAPGAGDRHRALQKRDRMLRIDSASAMWIVDTSTIIPPRHTLPAPRPSVRRRSRSRRTGARRTGTCRPGAASAIARRAAGT